MQTNIYAITINFHSDLEVKKLAESLATAVKATIIINNSRNNRGFAKAVNLGIKRALKLGATKILLINPDVIIKPGDVQALASIKADIVAPLLTFNRAGEKVKDYGGKVNFLLGRPTHLENVGVLKPIDYVSGACMLIDPKVFTAIGFFDENFFMYFEDVDFCLRAQKADLTISVANQIEVQHQITEHKSVFNSAKSNYILASNAYFISKWCSHMNPLPQIYLLFLKFSQLRQKLTAQTAMI